MLRHLLACSLMLGIATSAVAAGDQNASKKPGGIVKAPQTDVQKNQVDPSAARPGHHVTRGYYYPHPQEYHYWYPNHPDHYWHYDHPRYYHRHYYVPGHTYYGPAYYYGRPRRGGVHIGIPIIGGGISIGW